MERERDISLLVIDWKNQPQVAEAQMLYFILLSSHFILSAIKKEKKMLPTELYTNAFLPIKCLDVLEEFIYSDYIFTVHHSCDIKVKYVFTYS